MVYRRPSLPDLMTDVEEVPQHQDSINNITDNITHNIANNIKTNSITSNNITATNNDHLSLALDKSIKSIAPCLCCSCPPCHNNRTPTLRLKSVIFDSRLTYPSLEEFIDLSNGNVVTAGGHSSHLQSHKTATAVKCVDSVVVVTEIESEPLVSHITSDITTTGYSNHIDDKRSRKRSSSSVVTKDGTSNIITETTMNNSLQIQCPSFDVPDALPLPLECFKQAAKLMREQFGLSLFGFDVIFTNEDLNNLKNYHSLTSSSSSSSATTNSSSSNSSNHKSDFTQQQQQPPISMYVIDVNYFPSYKEVADFPSRLRKFLKSTAAVATGCC